MSMDWMAGGEAQSASADGWTVIAGSGLNFTSSSRLDLDGNGGSYAYNFANSIGFRLRRTPGQGTAEERSFSFNIYKNTSGSSFYVIFRNSGESNAELFALEFSAADDVIRLRYNYNGTIVATSSTGIFNHSFGSWYNFVIEVEYDLTNSRVVVWRDDDFSNPVFERNGAMSFQSQTATQWDGIEIRNSGNATADRVDDMRMWRKTISVASTTGFLAGETITDATTGGSAVIESVEDSTTLCVRGWNGTAFGNGNTINQTPTAASTTVSAPRANYRHGFMPNSLSDEGTLLIMPHMPDGNGNYSQLDGSDGNQIDNYLQVDEVAASTAEGTYNEGQAVGEKDSYAFANLDAAITDIRCVRVPSWAIHEGTTLIKARTFIRHGGTDYNGPEQTTGTDWSLVDNYYDEDPAGAIWTAATLNGAECGFEVRGT